MIHFSIANLCKYMIVEFDTLNKVYLFSYSCKLVTFKAYIYKYKYLWNKLDVYVMRNVLVRIKTLYE